MDPVTSYMGQIQSAGSNSDFAMMLMMILNIVKFVGLAALAVLAFIVLLKLNRYLNIKLKEKKEIDK